MTFLRDRSSSPPWEVPVKASTGPGVGFFGTATPLASMSRTPQEMMRRAQLAYHVNPWVGTAEALVTRKVVGLPWHLEDGEDEEYGDDAPPDVQTARMLMEQPQMMIGNMQPGTKSRRLMMSLTSRHLGLCGMSYWYGDQMGTDGIPLAWVYINPARVWDFPDEMGNLTGWMVDAKGVNSKGQPYGGMPLDVSEVLAFYLEPPDRGNLSSGLYERAMVKAQLAMLSDQHAAHVLATGGRIAGIVSPKEGSIQDEAFKTLVTEFRNVNEAPDAAKRTTIMQGPTDFTPTAANPSELDLVNLAKMNRDDVFTIWGIANSQAGVETPAGLNSGSTKGYDEAVVMQGPVHDRVLAITETIQYDWLDKYKPLVIELVIEEPEFDDDTPAYERLSKAQGTALTNAQRWDIIGIPPTGDPAIDNAILLPATTVLWATAPDEGKTEGVIEGTDEPAPLFPVAVPEEKASTRREFLGLRKSLDTRIVPATRKSLVGALDAQRAVIVAAIRAKGAHLAKKPGDDNVWWNGKREDDRLNAALKPHMLAVSDSVTARAKEVLDRGKAGFEDSVSDTVLRSMGLRIVGINKHTRDRIAELIAEGFADGLSPAEVADTIEQATLFSELRAETIARTETMFAYNAAAIDSYREFGVEKVQAIDGDEDDECRTRDGDIFDLDAAMLIEDHPNGTLDWAPYFGKASPTPPAPVVPPRPEQDIAAIVKAVLEAVKPPPITIQNGDVRLMRTVFDRDVVTGKILGSHLEPMDV